MTRQRQDRLLELVQSFFQQYLRGTRDAEMPAMRHALELLSTMQFPQQNTLVPEFDQLFKRLTAQQKEFWDEVAKPKASRRAALAQEYFDTTASLLKTLDRLSAALAAAVNHQDATIDQLSENRFVTSSWIPRCSRIFIWSRFAPTRAAGNSQRPEITTCSALRR